MCSVDLCVFFSILASTISVVRRFEYLQRFYKRFFSKLKRLNACGWGDARGWWWCAQEGATRSASFLVIRVAVELARGTPRSNNQSSTSAGGATQRRKAGSGKETKRNTHHGPTSHSVCMLPLGWEKNYDQLIMLNLVMSKTRLFKNLDNLRYTKNKPSSRLIIRDYFIN